MFFVKKDDLLSNKVNNDRIPIENINDDTKKNQWFLDYLNKVRKDVLNYYYIIFIIFLNYKWFYLKK